MIVVVMVVMKEEERSLIEDLGRFRFLLNSAPAMHASHPILVMCWCGKAER